MSKKTKEALVFVLYILAAVGFVVVVGLLVGASERHVQEQRNERHWNNVEWCQDQGGTIIYDGQWYDGCMVPTDTRPK